LRVARRGHRSDGRPPDPSTGFPRRQVVAALNQGLQHWIWSTDDGGALWDVRAHEFSELVDLFVDGGRMLAARTDGLWFLELEPVAVERNTQRAIAAGLQGHLQAVPGEARVILTSRESAVVTIA